MCHIFYTNDRGQLFTIVNEDYSEYYRRESDRQNGRLKATEPVYGIPQALEHIKEIKNREHSGQQHKDTVFGISVTTCVSSIYFPSPEEIGITEERKDTLRNHFPVDCRVVRISPGEEHIDGRVSEVTDTYVRVVWGKHNSRDLGGSYFGHDTVHDNIQRIK